MVKIKKVGALSVHVQKAAIQFSLTSNNRSDDQAPPQRFLAIEIDS
jgi:hypothetical protein